MSAKNPTSEQTMATSSSVVAQVSGHYMTQVLGPALCAIAGLGYSFYSLSPLRTALAFSFAASTWTFYIKLDGAEYTGEGRPDPVFSRDDWVIRTLRSYLRMTLHRTKEVEQQLVSHSATGIGQAVYALFPHGVNGDFRPVIDGMMPEAFPSVAPPRTLAANILFCIPGIRGFALKTGCVDAGRETAQKVLSKGLSILVLPGGLDEQVMTVHGRERVFLKKRFGFVSLAMQHGVPLVPAYVFGCSDLYFTSSFLQGLRMWIVRTLRVALPMYWGRWGFAFYPQPKGFPLPVAQNVVFGDPIFVPKKEKPSKEEVAVEHAKFIAALVALFDAHKEEFGAGGRTLEVM